MTNRVLLTGSTGFVGRTVLELLIDAGFSVSALGRSSEYSEDLFRYYNLPLKPNFDYSQVCKDIDCIVHCAAKIPESNAYESLEKFRDTNILSTISLARAAAENGVKRFVFISTAKVKGDSREPRLESITQDPFCGYSESKYEAEKMLFQLSKETDLEVVVIRPPLVYGPGVKSNFTSILKLVSLGIPLPFSGIRSNSRSLVSVRNLADLVLRCIDHPRAVNQIFFVSDGCDISTYEMVRKMSIAFGKFPLQLYVPVWFYRIVGAIFDRKSTIERLIGSLQVDISHTIETLDWKPPQSMEDGFRETANAFLKSKMSGKNDSFD